MDSKTTVVVEDVCVTARAILSVDHNVRLDIVSYRLVTTQRIESPWITGDICSRGSDLMSWRVSNSEATIVICDICVTIIATLAETFLEAVSFVYHDRFEMS